MAINIENFVDLLFSRNTVISCVNCVLQRAPGQTRIYTAGEKEYYSTLDVRKKGVPINENLKKDLMHVQELLDLHELGL